MCAAVLISAKILSEASGRYCDCSSEANLATPKVVAMQKRASSCQGHKHTTSTVSLQSWAGPRDKGLRISSGWQSGCAKRVVHVGLCPPSAHWCM